MAIDTTINAGAPPLLWSEVQSAFDKINQNFIDVQATIAGASITPVDFTNLQTNVSPAVDNNFDLGSPTNKWAAIFSSAYSTVPGNEFNGVWLGEAQIQGLPATGELPARVNLPAGSLVGGNLIVDPNKTAFKEIQVNNDLSIVATEFADSFNLISGDGINLTVNSSNDSIEIANAGIIDVIGNDGISIVNNSGEVTITNTGVRSLTSTTSMPAGRTAGAGINIDSATGDDIKITNAGVISVTAGSGIGIIWNPATGDATIRNDAAAVNSFAVIQIDDDLANRLIADAIGDTFRINSGQGITLTKDTTQDSMTITVDPVFDLKGSVFGDDSTIIVDAVEGKVYAEFFGDLTGNSTGYHSGDVKGSIFGDNSTKIVDAIENKVYGGIFATTLRTEESKIALGRNAGNTTQGPGAIAIGEFAGETSQGGSTVAIGPIAGNISQGNFAIAVGSIAGYTGQGSQAVAIGREAGRESQGSNAVSIGYIAGYTGQEAGAVAIGYTTGQITQGEAAVAIGWGAGQTNQGDYSIAIGFRAGFANQNVSSIVLNASGAALNAAAAGLYINPIRNQTGVSGVLQYDISTSEVSYSSALGSVSGTFTGNIFTNLIDSADSSAITVTPATIFSSDVVMENDLSVNQRFLLRGSRILNLTELKSIVAASTSFSDFQTRIAALV
jgi:hypothetical protein